MIDRAARDQFSRNLRLLVSGKISNDRFEAAIPETKDPAIAAIVDMAGLLYSDMKAHHLVGRNSIGPSDRREVLRWILFLDSDLEYLWPKMPLPGLQPLRLASPAVARWLRWPNAISPGQAIEFLASGDHRAWPFISRSECRHALKNPRRLAGKPKCRLSQVEA